MTCSSVFHCLLQSAFHSTSNHESAVYGDNPRQPSDVFKVGRQMAKEGNNCVRCIYVFIKYIVM